MNCRPCTAAAVTIGLAASALLALGVAPALQPSAPEQATPPATAPAKTAEQAAKTSPAAGVLQCTVDGTHSVALFRIHHMGAGQFWGRFKGISGTFSFTPGSAEGLKFDVAIKTDSIDTGVEKLDQHLRSPDFFAVQDFPEMKFVSNSAKAVGKDMYEVSGDLTLHGVTKPIKANVEFTGLGSGRGGQSAGFEATMTVRRSEFGMTYGVEKGALGNDVRVIVSLEGGVAAPAGAGAAKKN